MYIELLRCLTEAAPGIQVVDAQRSKEIRLRPFPQPGQHRQTLLGLRLALFQDLPTGSGKGHLLQGKPPPPRPDSQRVGLAGAHGQIGTAHVGRGGKILPQDEPAVQPGCSQAVAALLGQILHLVQPSLPGQEGHHVALVAVGHHGAAPAAQELLHQVQPLGLEALRVGAAAAQHPHGMHGRNVHMKKLRQPPHLHRLVAQNGAHQLRHHHLAVSLAPNARGQMHHLPRPAYEIWRQGRALLQ